MPNICLWFQAQEELNEAKRIYDELNNELHKELPALYDRYADNLDGVFTLHLNFIIVVCH